MSLTSQSRSTYTFGVLSFALLGEGCYFGGPKLEARVAALTIEQVREANRIAWKLRRAAERRMERYSNVTMHGCGPHDRATQEQMVARAVCDATWKRMRAAS